MKKLYELPLCTLVGLTPIDILATSTPPGGGGGGEGPGITPPVGGGGGGEGPGITPGTGSAPMPNPGGDPYEDDSFDDPF